MGKAIGKGVGTRLAKELTTGLSRDWQGAGKGNGTGVGKSSKGLARGHAQDTTGSREALISGNL